MEASEFRIGNWVDDGVIENHYVSLYPDLFISVLEEKQEVFPIPLTEEWLLKFEFKKVHGDSFEKDNICIHPDYAGYPDEVSYWLDGFGLNNKFKYVHQLQNLIFALTGKEPTTHNSQPTTA